MDNEPMREGFDWAVELFVTMSNSPAANGSANVASVVGLVVTLVILWRVAAIRRSFLLRVRFPQLAADLRSHVSTLRNAMDEYDTRKDRFLEELYPCASTLRWILPLTSRSARGSGKNARWQLRWYRWLRAARTEERARHLYRTLLEFESDLRNLSEYTKWE